jgi:glycosyltransferase involved in cell wall biosynthesis/GT2 family glycosyltransferase
MARRMHLILGVPTLNRYDLLGKLFASAEAGRLKPSTYLIVDNGGRFREEALNMPGVEAALARGAEIDVLSPECNLGVAASWNAILNRAGSEPVAVANDDVELHADSLEVIARALADGHDFVAAGGWCLFSQTVRCTELVGPYDENFWPAYYEDSDYERRLSLAGIAPHYVPGPKHKQWATTDADSSGEIALAPAKSAEYFRRKWGGLPGEDLFAQPFNGVEHPPLRLNPKQIAWGRPATRIMLGVPCFAEPRELLLRSIRSFAEGGVQVVAIDNGATLEVKEALRELSHDAGITIFRNPENVYVNPAWNQFASMFLSSECEILVIANSDLIACPGWASSLRMRLDRNANEREYWVAQLVAEEEVVRPRPPSSEAISTNSVQGSFFGMTREAASIAFPIPELLLHCGDDWIHELLSEAGFRQQTLIGVRAWHKGFVSGTNLPEFHAITAKDRMVWDSRLQRVCRGIGRIERQFHERSSSASDINEHLPLLSAYAKACTSVTELGAGNSTWGLLHGRPKRMRSYDVRSLDLHHEKESSSDAGIDFEFRLGDSMSVDLEETDLLFIDTIHNYAQLRRELSLHESKVKKFIIMHDTETYGLRDESGAGPGLWPAVEEFLESYPHWRIEKRLRNNNGLTVLVNTGDRGSPTEPSPPPSKVTLVSAFFRLRDRAVDEDEMFDRFEQLAACGLPIILFLDRNLVGRLSEHPNVHVVPSDFDSLWAFRRSDDRRLPTSRTPAKDTRDFILLQNSKIDLLSLARQLDGSSHFAWIDFGIMKTIRDPAGFHMRLRALDPPPSCVLAPGCWGQDPNGGIDPERVNWRFCGGFLLVDRDSIPPLAAAHHAVFARFPVLTWEVNVWAEMERTGQRFDWYAANHDDSIIGSEPQRPRICLNMIVRNESKIIERCLTAALPHIDTWVIVVDTATTDDTAEKIERFFVEHGVRGRLLRSQFLNFAQQRNFALAAAKEDRNWDYVLLIDADMVIFGALDKAALIGPAYRLVQHDSGLDYTNVRLVHRDAPARYIGVTHEYMSVEGAADLPGLEINDLSDGGSKNDKSERDIRLLKAGLAEEPGNERYMFYLANTFREAGRHDEAIRWYRRRIERGGWAEEVWSSHYNIARCYLEMKNLALFVQACLDAYDFRPTRGEPLKLLARFYRERGQNEAALLAAEALKAIEYPTDALFIERDVYDFGADQEIAIAGFYSKLPRRREAGYRACAELTAHFNNEVREEARKNFTFYARSATELFGAEIREIDWLPEDGYVPMNPSVCVVEGRRLVLARTVNYTVTAQGQYPTLDGSGVIRTRNHMLEMDENWQPTQSTRIEDVTGLPRNDFPVEGYEDCRLWISGSSYHVSATVRDRPDNAAGHCEMVIARLDAHWQIVETRVIRDYERDKPQKNWMPVVGRPGVFLYLCDPTVAISVSGDTVELARSNPPACLVELRGGSQLIPYGEGWLCVTHEVVWRPDRMYLHRFVRLDASFRIIAFTEPFYFERIGIEFCAGLALDGHQLVASFGTNDSSAHLAFFNRDAILHELGTIVHASKAR